MSAANQHVRQSVATRAAEQHQATPRAAARSAPMYAFVSSEVDDEFKLHLKTSKGEVRDLVVKPGEKKVETFSATPGFKVELTWEATVGKKTYSGTETLKYELPEGCDSQGEGGGLPLTGAAAGSIAGGAGVLLAVGAGLFFMARRRKVKFTA